MEGQQNACSAAQVSGRRLARVQFPDQDQLLLLWFDYRQGIDTHSFCKQSEKHNLARILSALQKSSNPRKSELITYHLIHWGVGRDSG